MSEYLYVQRKQPIMTSRPGENGKPVTVPLYTHEAFVAYLVSRDDRFVKSPAGWRAANRIEQELLRGGDWWRFHPGDHAMLKEAANEPTCGYPSMDLIDVEKKKKVGEQPYGRLLEPYVSAIDEPATERPADYSPEEAPKPKARASRKSKRPTRRSKR